MMELNGKIYLTAKEAARLYGCTVGRIYQLADAKRIEQTEIVGVKLFERESVIKASKKVAVRRPRKDEKQRSKLEENAVATAA